MAAAKRDLCVEVRRDLEGKVYSRILDRAVISPYGDLTRVKEKQRYVVVDRANGRQYDVETVQNRAQYLAELLGVDYVEDLTWPCKAEQGFKNCQCPRCAQKGDERARATTRRR